VKSKTLRDWKMQKEGRKFLKSRSATK